jgi:hypothetical protein
MGGTTGADARLLQRLPLAAGAEHDANGLQRCAILATGPMAPQGVQCAPREQRYEALPQLVRHTPITAVFLVVFMHR